MVFKTISSLLQLHSSTLRRPLSPSTEKVMFAVLRNYGIPEPVVNAIGALYNNSESAVMVVENISEPL